MLHVVRSALAIRAQDGTWALQFGFIAFSPEEIPTVLLTIETKSILAVRQACALGDTARAAVESVLSDPCSIEIAGHVLQLPAPGYAPLSTYHASHLPRFPGPQRLPAITVTRQGTSSTVPVLPSLPALDLELRAHSAPYNGLGDLLVELGNPFLAQEMGNSALPRIEIVIAPPARIIRGDINNGELVVDIVSSPKIDHGKLALGLRCIQAKGPHVQHLSFTGVVDCENTSPLPTIKFRQSLADVGLVQNFLTYDGEFLGSWWARDQSITFSARSALHKAVDSDNALVAKFFDDRNAFEEHILVLLSLLGLDCLYYGNITELKDGPDILALSNQGHLYVIECTTGDINSRGKLRRLYERTNAIRAALANSAYRPGEILAVMVTSGTKSETLHCLDELANYKIAIVCREEITALLSQIEAPPTADRLFASAVATIPTTQQQLPAALNVP
jgi:hypothetical protein